jgi:hypothetical protein
MLEAAAAVQISMLVLEVLEVADQDQLRVDQEL